MTHERFEDILKPYDPDAPITEWDLLNWANQLAMDEWYDKNFFDEDGNYLDLRLLEDDEREDTNEE